MIGAGVAGLAAALAATEAGLEVIVIDAAAPREGGASRISVGGCLAVGTPLQRQLGVQDSVELALEDWLRAGGGAADPDWARRYIEHSCEEVYLWCERVLGTHWHELRHQELDSVPRWHLPAGGGEALVRALEARLDMRQACIWPATAAQALLLRDGRVLGATVGETGGTDATLGAGDTHTIHAPATVASGTHIHAPATVASGAHTIHAGATLIATGGFTNNPEMLTAHSPSLRDMSRLLCGGGATALGFGHALLEQAGAAFAGMENVWIYPVGTPNPRDPSGKRGLVVRGIADEIWLNRDGVRFHDESRRGGATGAPALLAQPQQTSWGIFDARAAAGILLLNDPHFGSAERSLPERVQELWDRSTDCHRSASQEGLADAIGLSPATLRESLARYNAAIDSGAERDPEWGRPLADARKIEQSPYCAIRYLPLAQKNFGGALTDTGCRVLSASDSAPIPGLYAAGEVAGMAGGHINGRAALEGAMFGPCLYSGRIAGKTTARDLAAMRKPPQRRA